MWRPSFKFSSACGLLVLAATGAATSRAQAQACWRLFGGLYVEPPISGLGSNEPSISGLTLTVIRSWT